MSLNISAEVEARILGNAERAGVSIEDYLDQVLGESEEFAADVRRLEATGTSPSREEIQGKISRGLAQGRVPGGSALWRR